MTTRGQRLQPGPRNGLPAGLAAAVFSSGYLPQRPIDLFDFSLLPVVEPSQQANDVLILPAFLRFRLDIRFQPQQVVLDLSHIPENGESLLEKFGAKFF